jgi:hypothetical protein
MQECTGEMPTTCSIVFEIEFILVNTVAWAPYEYGLMLACGSSDGAISIISSTGKNKICYKLLARKFLSR